MIFALTTSNSSMSLRVCAYALVSYMFVRVQARANISDPSFVLCPAGFPKVHCISKWRWIALSAFCRTIAACLMCIIYCVFAKAWTCSCVYVHLCLLRAYHICLFETLKVNIMQLCSCILKFVCMCVCTMHTFVCVYNVWYCLYYIEVLAYMSAFVCTRE